MDRLSAAAPNVLFVSRAAPTPRHLDADPARCIREARPGAAGRILRRFLSATLWDVNRDVRAFQRHQSVSPERRNGERTRQCDTYESDVTEVPLVDHGSSNEARCRARVRSRIQR
jgi:hypothetical protein